MLDLNLLREIFNADDEFYSLFYSDMMKSIAMHSEKIDARREKNLKAAFIGDRDAGERAEFQQDSLYLIRNVYPTALRHSLFITLYSLLESSFENIAREVCKQSRCKISVTDMAGKGIYRTKKYLNKVHGVNFDSVNLEWEIITKFNTVRNLIVHANGVIGESPKNKRLYDSLLQAGYIAVVDDNGVQQLLELTHDGLEKFHTTIFAFMSKVINIVDPYQGARLKEMVEKFIGRPES